VYEGEGRGISRYVKSIPGSEGEKAVQCKCKSGGLTSFTVKVKVFGSSSLFILGRILPFPYKNVRKDAEGKCGDYVLDSQPQLVLQGLDVLVGREVQSIEACVASWQLARIPVLFYGEPSWAVRALKVLETVDRYPRGSCGELKEAGFLLWGPRAKDLPEPGDDLVLSIVTTIIGELGPIVPEKRKVSRR